MRFYTGVRLRLPKFGLEPADVRLVLARLETAVPHLEFDPWRITDHYCDSPEGEVARQNGNKALEIRLNLDQNLRLTCHAKRRAGQISSDDYKFLLYLAREAAILIQSRLGGALSLFDFGTLAVADVIKGDTGFDGDILSILRFVRALTQETYESQRLAYGVVVSSKLTGSEPILQSFDSKRLKCLTDGFSTALLLDGHGKIAGYAALHVPSKEALSLSRRPWWVAGLAERAADLQGVGIALGRSGEMTIVSRRRLWFSHRTGRWQIWNHPEIIERLRSEWRGRGKRGRVDDVLRCLYHLALDMSFRRSGCLLIVLCSSKYLGDLLVSMTDAVGSRGRRSIERALDTELGRKAVQNTDRRILADIASLDGAVIVDRNGSVLAYGAMTKPASGTNQGARTRAAVAASKLALVIKVSSDGQIAMYSNRRCFLEL
ncbi:hypothetical protein [Burkholderia sp. BCC0322]|uniref:hypothetical protein n=1 Tax=unclassified Burkholderia TaxID=2613784 RepID=UPI00158BF1C1|nr:hypothetical protein [Burkholderia sp. BCC0322]